MLIRSITTMALMLLVTSSNVMSFTLPPFLKTGNFGVGSGPRSVYAADFDRDGLVDLAVANRFSDNIAVLLNNNSQNDSLDFTQAVFYDVGNNPRSVFGGDFDLDGDIDLVVANLGSNNLTVLINFGDGTFDAGTDYDMGGQPMSVHVADFNNDNYPDFVAVNSTSNRKVSVFMNQQDGTFQLRNSIVSRNLYAVFAADLDGDGFADLAVASKEHNSVLVLINDGAGNFAYDNEYVVGSDPRSLVAADFDLDGDMDLAVANSSSDNVTILRNDGSGLYTEWSVVYAINGSESPIGDTARFPSSIYASDANGDGNPDLAVTFADSDWALVFYFSTSLDQFDTQELTCGFECEGLDVYATGEGSAPFCVVVADFDNDSDNDFAIAVDDIDSLAVYYSHRSTPTAVNDEVIKSLPDSYRLEQNYPNPFNPTTEIVFSLPVAADTRLDVFNTLGQLVTTLVNQVLPMGEHVIEWNGTSQSGDEVASGVYLYRLTAGEFESTRKMSLIK